MKVQALHLGKKIHTKKFQDKLGLRPMHRDPLIYEYSSSKFVAVLKYGVIVFWDFSEGEINEFLSIAAEFVIDRFETPFEEDTEIKILKKGKNEIKNNQINLNATSLENIAVTSLIIGRSVALDYYDKAVEKALNEFDSVMKAFEEKGKTDLSGRELLKKVGFAMNVRHLVVTQLALLDKPELTWEDRQLDNFYNELSEDFEIEDRYAILNQKLESIFRNAEFILDYLNSSRSHTLEVIIVFLILIEIVIFFYEKFFEALH